jgi:hypothetical protein
MTDEEKKAAEAKAAAEAKSKTDVEAAAKAQPFATFDSAEAFNKRMEREARSILKAKGVDPDKIEEELAALKKMREDHAVAEEAKKSEIQKSAEARATAELAAKTAMGEAEEAKLRAHLYRCFAEQGIKNFDYAFYAVTNKLSTMGETEELDEVDFIKKMMADPTQAAALGVAAVAKVEGVTTTDQGGRPDPKPGSPAGDAQKPADAFSQTGEQFRAAVAARYGFQPPV